MTVSGRFGTVFSKNNNNDLVIDVWDTNDTTYDDAAIFNGTYTRTEDYDFSNAG